MPPVWFLFLRIALAFLGLLWFPINFWIVCSSTVKIVMEKKFQKKQKKTKRSSCRGIVEMNETRNHEVVGLIPALPQWDKDLAFP